MASYINTIDIPEQESKEALAKAFAAALAKAVEWNLDADGVTVWASSSHELGFRFGLDSASRAYVIPMIVNSSGTTLGASASYVYVIWAAQCTYKLHWIKTSAGTLAFGITDSSTVVPVLTTVIGKNEAGVWSGVHMSHAQTSSNPLSILTTTQTGFKNLEVPPVNYVGCPLSMVRLPDIINGGMFADIYLVISTPVSSPSALYYIGGKYYRPIKCNTTAQNFPTLAIPVG